MAKKKKNKYPQLTINFENKTAQVVFGLLFLCLSTLLFLSFISFLLSWKKDFDLLQLNTGDLLLNTEIIANNLLGKIGASLGQFFIYQQFGIASFLIPFFLFIAGLQIFTNQYIIKLNRLLRNSLFLCLWLTTFFGLYFSQTTVLGGYNGILVSTWLISLLGTTGTSLILGFSMLIFLGIYYRWTPEKIQEFFKRKEKNIDLNDFTEKANPEEEIFEEQIQETIDLSTNSETETPEPSTDNVVKEMTIEQPKKKEIVASTPEEVQMDIEVKDEEILTDKEVNKALEEFGEYDPTLDLGRYKHPTIDLMIEYPNSEVTVNQEELEANKNQIVETLNNYKIEISKIKATVGPTVTLYEIVPAPGVRISKIKGLENDIALSLAALGIRIIAPLTSARHDVFHKELACRCCCTFIS